MSLLQDIVITEGQGPVPVQLTLQEIIKAGKITNGYQTFVLAWLSEFFKDGAKPLSLLGSPVSAGALGATSLDTISMIKSLDSDSAVAFAQYLLDLTLLSEPPLTSSVLSPAEFVQFALSKQR